MKLELTNFRCHTSRTFHLEDNSITLLNGDSGKGKTSIFKAINFALFGKEQRTATFGQRKSKVVLTVGNITISRTKTPNHLLLEVHEDDECDNCTQRLEDAAAQGYIDTYFGSHFLQTCYLSQKCLDNFFTISRESRAELLRALSIQTFDINTLKAKNKADVKERKTLLVQTTATYTYAKKEYDSRKFPPGSNVEPVFPLATLNNNESFQDAMDKYKATNEENNKQYTVTSQQLKQLYSKLQTAQNSTQHVESTKLELRSTEQQLADLEERCKASEGMNLKEKQLQVSNYQTELTTAKAVKQQKETEEKLEDEKCKFEQQRKEKLDAIKKKISDATEDKELEEEIADTTEELDFCKQAKLAYIAIQQACKINKLDANANFSAETFKEDVLEWCEEFEGEETAREEAMEEHEQKITSYQSEITQAKMKYKQLDEQSKQKTQSCPSCKTSLAVVQGHIHSFDVKLIQQQKTKVEKELTELEGKLTKEKETMQSLQQLQKREKALYDVCERYKESLDNDIDSLDNIIEENEKEIARLTLVQKQVTKWKAEMELVKKAKSDVFSFLTKELEKLSLSINLKTSVTRSLEDIEVDLQASKMELAECKKQLDLVADLKVQKATLQSRVKVLSKRLEEFTSLVYSIEMLKANIEESEAELEIRARQQQEYNEMVDKLSSWKVSYNIYTEYKRLLENMEDAKTSMDLISRGLTCALKMEKVIVDVESEALQTFLIELNAECEKHMQAMFDGEFALKVRYEKVGDEDSKKFYVDVDVYKNAEEVPYESLSGGESDRCSLVLFLAFNKLSNGKMLLLDECLSSLHAEMVEDIVEHIKQEFSEKICVMTLHQTTKGIFDHVVNV
jgi:DNA repair exonuclease SbcCD ATPase subunit